MSGKEEKGRSLVLSCLKKDKKNSALRKGKEFGVTHLVGGGEGNQGKIYKNTNWKTFSLKEKRGGGTCARGKSRGDLGS